MPKAWKFTRFGTVQGMFLHFLCLVLGNCFWENVDTLFRRFSKTCKIAGEGIVGTILQIIVKLVGQGPVCMVFT